MRHCFNLSTAAIVLGVAFATTQVVAHEDHGAKNGGVLVETKIGDVEIVAKPQSIQIYITDHGKPMKLDGATAKITLLNGTEKLDANAVLVGDKLEAKGAFKVVKGTKGIAVVTLAGKAPTTARFEIK